jgi:protein-tyrosine phosphatase|uniref:Uncharacterized protein n=1 Tax=viral metagenome TaxID=1070528 RepID=A0A6C0D259_9ZZZZ
MNNCSFFIPSKALFGGFPTQEETNNLEIKGVRYFVNLTCDNEDKIYPYTTIYNKISFPIHDRNIPDNISEFSEFIIKISNIITNLNTDELVYIHCKGGHGRSGIVVACVLCYLYNMDAESAIQYTNTCHNTRINMKEKWRKIGSPQTIQQKNFVHLYKNSIT